MVCLADFFLVLLIIWINCQCHVKCYDVVNLGFEHYTGPQHATEGSVVFVQLHPARCIVVIHLNEYPSVLLGQGQAYHIAFEPELP